MSECGTAVRVYSVPQELRTGESKDFHDLPDTVNLQTEQKNWNEGEAAVLVYGDSTEFKATWSEDGFPL